MNSTVRHTTDKAVAILSGGLDSTTAAGITATNRNIALALTFDYGQRAAKKESAAARAFCRSRGIPHKVISLPWLASFTASPIVRRSGKIPQTSWQSVDSFASERAKIEWVPNRNMVFISIAAAFAEGLGCKTIVAGFNREEAKTFPDNSRGFLERVNEALLLSTLGKVRLVSPTIEMSKAEIALKFFEMGLDPVHIWSCYDGGKKMCGVCESCSRLIRAVRKIGKWKSVEERFEKLCTPTG